MKLVKIVLWLLGVLVVLGVGAVVVLTTLVDPNEFKPRITELVREQTGRDLKIEGDLSLTYFPWLGLSTGPLSLSNREGFGDAPMVAVEESNIRVKLMPLLSRQVEVDTIVLTRPRINLSRKADGAASWDDLVALGQGGGQSESGSGEDAAMIAGLAVQGVSIVDGQLSWDDQLGGQQIELSELNLETGTLEPGQPLDIDLAVHVEGNVLPEAADVKLVTTTTLSENLELVSLENTDFSIEMQTMGATLSAAKVSYALDAGLVAITGLSGSARQNDVATEFEITSLNFSQSDGSLELPSLSLNQDGLSFNGNFSAKNLLTAPSVNGQFELKASDIESLLGRNRVEANLEGNSIEKLDLSMAFSYADNAVAIHNLYTNITANGQLNSLSAPGLKVDLDSLTAALPTFTFSQDDFTLTGSFEGGGFMGDVSDMSISANLEIKADDIPAFLTRNRIELETGDNTLENIDAKVSFRLADNVVSIRDFNTVLGANGQTGTVAIPELGFGLANGALSLPTFTLEQGDFSVTGTANGEALLGGLADMKLAGNVAIRSANLPDLLARNHIPVELPEGLLEAIDTSFDFDLRDNQLVVKNLEAAVDEMTLEGELAISDFEAPAYRFDLAVNQLDLDRLTAAGEGDEENSEQPSDAEQVLLPVAPLQGLEVDGHLAIGKMKTSGLEFDNVELTVTSAADVLRVHPLKAQLLGGTIDIESEYDVSGPAPALKSVGSVANLDVGALLVALEITDMVEGTGTINLDLSGTGVDIDQQIASLNGTIGVKLLDGAIRGYDLQATLLKLQELYQGQSAVAESRPDVETRFAELSSDFDVKQGVFSTENMSMKAPVFRMAGRGSMDLPREQIDFVLDVSVVGSLEGQGGDALEKLKGITIPMKVSGALAAPAYALDLAGLLKAQANQEIKKKLLEKLNVGGEETATESATGAEPKATDAEELIKDEIKKSIFKVLGLD